MKRGIGRRSQRPAGTYAGPAANRSIFTDGSLFIGMRTNDQLTTRASGNHDRSTMRRITVVFPEPFGPAITIKRGLRGFA